MKAWLRNRRINETSVAVLLDTRETCELDCKVRVVRYDVLAMVRGLKHSPRCDRKHKRASK